MRYYDALVDIAAQVGDPALEDFEERAKDHFTRAISFLRDAEGFDLMKDAPGFHWIKKNIVFHSTLFTYNMGLHNIREVLSLYPPPGTAQNLLVTRKTSKDWEKFSFNSLLRPTKYDLFYNPIGNVIHALWAATSEYDPASDLLWLEYIRDIDSDLWVATSGSGTDFQDTNSADISSGTLIAGKMYHIVDFIAGDDFTNVNGINEDDSVFVASGITPTTWTNSSVLQRVYMFSEDFVKKATALAVQTIKQEDEEQN